MPQLIHHYGHAPELTEQYVKSVWTTLPRHLHPTVLLAAESISAQLSCHITVATESFQRTGSFKFRAAYNLLSEIPHSKVIASSSGNFGQAVALACKLLGKRCTVVMPNNAAKVKVEATKSYGAEIDFIDTKLISRAERVKQLLQDNPTAFEAKPYDDYRVVAGNSTLGKEIFAYKDFDTVIVPVGGGGLSSGLVIARDTLGRNAQIIGAEPQLANDAARSLRSGALIRNEHEPDTIADGARTLSLGNLNWEILKQGMADVIEVPEDATLEALRMYFKYANLKVEPTGALSLGAVLINPERFKGQNICCVVSGENVDPKFYADAITEDV